LAPKNEKEPEGSKAVRKNQIHTFAGQKCGTRRRDVATQLSLQGHTAATSTS